MITALPDANVTYHFYYHYFGAVKTPEVRSYGIVGCEVGYSYIPARVCLGSMAKGLEARNVRSV